MKANRSFVLFLVMVLSVQIPAAFAQGDNQIQTQIQQALSGSAFKNVRVTVQNGIATLSGTVELVATKEQADRKAHHASHTVAIRNEIQVVGAPGISDAQLQKKLVSAIAHSRIGYQGQSPAIRDVTPFNAIGVAVRNGVVTLGGHAYDPISADDAVAIASYMPGVRDVVNTIQVDPLSPMDDRIRLATYRSIYGFSSLNRYAIDPAKPIRISVQNGNVTLYGEVDSEADRNIAGIRANSVPGVFSVTNHLQVAGAQPERK